MLLTTLALASSLLLPQDTAAADDAVSACLLAAREELYDPVEAGLESLAFEVPFLIPGNPMLGSSEPIRVATFAIRWTKAEGPQIDVTMATGLDPKVTQMLQMSGMSAEMLRQTIAQQPLLYSLNLNLDAGAMGEAFDAEVSGEGGARSITFRPKPTAEGVMAESIVWAFGDGVLKTKTSKGPGPMGGTMTNVETYTWKASPLGEGLLVERIDVVQDMGMFKLGNSVVPSYEVADGIVVLTGYVQHSDGVPAMGVPASDQHWTFENLVVNGEKVGAAEAPSGSADG